MHVLIGNFWKNYAQYGIYFTFYECYLFEFVDNYFKEYSNNLRSPHNVPLEFAICYSIMLPICHI